MLRDGLAQRVVGGVDPEHLRQAVQHADPHLAAIALDRVVGDLEGHIRVRDEEIGLVVHVQDLKVLHRAVHHGAGVHTDQRVEVLITALDGALQQGARILAGVVGHVIGGDVDGAGIGGAQSGRKAVVHIEQDFRNVEAGVTQADLAVGLRLLDQLVVGVLKQTLKVDQMLKIFQMLHTSFKEFLLHGVLPSPL